MIPSPWKIFVEFFLDFEVSSFLVFLDCSSCLTFETPAADFFSNSFAFSWVDAVPVDDVVAVEALDEVDVTDDVSDWLSLRAFAIAGAYLEAVVLFVFS